MNGQGELETQQLGPTVHTHGSTHETEVGRFPEPGVQDHPEQPSETPPPPQTENKQQKGSSWVGPGVWICGHSLLSQEWNDMIYI